MRETLGLLSTLNWDRELHLALVDFELNSKIVVYCLNSNKDKIYEFGDTL